MRQGGGFSLKSERDPVVKKRGDLGAGRDSGLETLIQNHVARRGVVPSPTREPGISTAPRCPKPSPDHSEQEHHAYLVQTNAHLHQLRVTSCEGALCHPHRADKEWIHRQIR